jgi:TonB family protein
MMNRDLFLNFLLCLSLLSAFNAAATSQSTELPSAPVPSEGTKSGPTPLSLPPGTSRVIARSEGEPPPASADEEFCYAPAEGLYAPQPKDPSESKDSTEKWYALKRYESAIHDQVEARWHRHMPWQANDFWIKGKVVVVRFAIMPNGSIDPPIVTLSSGRKDYDKSVMDAVTKSAPFPPLPSGAVRPWPICFRFGYFTDPQPKHAPAPDPLAPMYKSKP